MMMPLAVVVAAGVAVDDGIIEEHRQHLLHGKFGSASVDADTQQVQHVDRPLACHPRRAVGLGLAYGSARRDYREPSGD